MASSVSGSASDNAIVRIDVRGAVDDTATTAIGTPVTINVVANDSCPGCTLSSVTAPTSGSAVLSAGAVRYTPPAGFSGKATFSYTLSQGGASTSAPVTVSVLPQAVDDAATTFVGADVQILPLDNDLCANCALTSLGTPTAGTASRAGDIVTYSPATTGSATFTYIARDGSGDAFTGTITVHVVNPPALTADTATTPSGTPAVVDVLGNDQCPGCDVLINSDPAHGGATPTSSAAPSTAPRPASPASTPSPTPRPIPTTGAWASAQVTVTVIPVARDVTAATGMDIPITVDVLANDACTGCTLTVDTTSADATATVASSKIHLVPDSGFTGTVTVRYTATDPTTTDSSHALLTVEVNDARPDWTTTPYGTGVSGLDVLTNDTCPGCSVTAVTPASSGTSSFDGVGVSWAPTTPFAGLVTFGYTAGDGGAHVVSSTVRILVTADVKHINVATNGTATVHVLAPGACPGCVVTLRNAPAQADLDQDGAGGFALHTGAILKRRRLIRVPHHRPDFRPTRRLIGDHHRRRRAAGPTARGDRGGNCL